MSISFFYSPGPPSCLKVRGRKIFSWSRPAIAHWARRMVRSSRASWMRSRLRFSRNSAASFMEYFLDWSRGQYQCRPRLRVRRLGVYTARTSSTSAACGSRPSKWVRTVRADWRSFVGCPFRPSHSRLVFAITTETRERRSRIFCASAIPIICSAKGVCLSEAFV